MRIVENVECAQTTPSVVFSKTRGALGGAPGEHQAVVNPTVSLRLHQVSKGALCSCDVRASTTTSALIGPFQYRLISECGWLLPLVAEALKGGQSSFRWRYSPWWLSSSFGCNPPSQIIVYEAQAISPRGLQLQSRCVHPPEAHVRLVAAQYICTLVNVRGTLQLAHAAGREFYDDSFGTTQTAWRMESLSGRHPELEGTTESLLKRQERCLPRPVVTGCTRNAL